MVTNLGCVGRRINLGHSNQVVIDCATCGFIHADPLPSAENLKKFYEEDFYTTEKPLYFDRYMEDAEWWDYVYSERLLRLENFLSSLNLTAKKVLDVGSGPGFFLKSAQELRWSAKGLEPSLAAVKFSSDMGLDVVRSFFNQESVNALGKFDAVHLSEVLEHTPNPLEILGLVNVVLNDGGVVCICVPNDFNKFQTILTENFQYPYWWVDTQHHVNYFNHQSLSNLVAKSGFEILDVSSTFPLDIFLMMGEGYIGDDVVGRSVHKKRVTFELNLHKSGQNSLKMDLYKKFSELGLGREIILYARKK